MVDEDGDGGERMTDDRCGRMVDEGRQIIEEGE
jgi:hypothetical protein